MERSVQDLLDHALDRLYEAVDAGRAVWRGLVLIGHRRSIRAGHMFWALPGGDFADGKALLTSDRGFNVIWAPTPRQLADQQALERELTQ